MSIAIRKFQPNDAEEIRQLIVGIMSHEFPQSASAYSPIDLDHIAQIYGGEGEAFFVATDGARIVGTVAVKREDERVALLRRLFVAADYRKRRIGVSLMDRAIEFCKEKSYQEIVFKTCVRMDAAIQLCQKKHFHQRAKLEMAGLELLKFVLFLGGENAVASKAH